MQFYSEVKNWLISDGTRVWLLGVVVAFGSWIAKETIDIEQGTTKVGVIDESGVLPFDSHKVVETSQESLRQS